MVKYAWLKHVFGTTYPARIFMRQQQEKTLLGLPDGSAGKDTCPPNWPKDPSSIPRTTPDFCLLTTTLTCMCVHMHVEGGNK